MCLGGDNIAVTASFGNLKEVFLLKPRKCLTAILTAAIVAVLLPTGAFAAENATAVDSWDGTADTSWYDESKTTFEIATAEELAGLAALVNGTQEENFEDCLTFEGKTIILVSDIDLKGHEWNSIGWGHNTPLGAFCGVFDGNGHCIYNLYSHESYLPLGQDDEGKNIYNHLAIRSGLFGAVLDGVVKNLGVSNADIYLSAEDSRLNGVGILVDCLTNSTLENCWTTGSIVSESQTDKYYGGVVGFPIGTYTISGCHSSANITVCCDHDSIGGIVGCTYDSTDSVVNDCWFDGKLSISVDDAIDVSVGGIVGYAEGTKVKNCLVATTELPVDSDPGGHTSWVVFSQDVNAENCYWPDNDIYPASLANEESGVSAGTAIKCDDKGNYLFNDPAVLEGLQENAAEGIVWVEGLHHPSFEGDKNNLSADYTAVEAAIEKANALNENEYKDFSAVKKALENVSFDMSAAQQAQVDAMAKAIEDAVAALEYKDADYSKVDAAIEKAETLNRDDYQDFTAVDAAIQAVVRGKPITEQAEVDAMAMAIENAITALEKTVSNPSTGADTAPVAGLLTLLTSAGLILSLTGKKRQLQK